MLKKIGLFLLISVLLLQWYSLGLILFSCMPRKQINSKWQTDDGSFVFYVTEDNRIYGKISTGNDVVFVKISNPKGVVYFMEIPYFDGNDPNMFWDSIQRSSKSSQYVSVAVDQYSIKRRPFSNKIEFSGSDESNFGLKKEFTVTRVAENLVPEEIEFPPINLPKYYYIYEQYQDVFDGKINSFSEFEDKYGKCKFVSHEEISGRNVYYYVAGVDKDDQTIYYITFRREPDDSMFDVSLITSEILPENIMQIGN